MDPVEALAERYLAARRGVAAVARPSPEQRALDQEAGYRAQAIFRERMGGSPAGYKIGATNPAVQQAMATEEPFHGGIVHEGLLPATEAEGAIRATLEAGAHFAPSLECELAFRMKAGPSEPTRQSVLLAVGEVMPAFEIVDPCALDWRGLGAVESIANNGLHARWLIGEPFLPEPGADLADLEVELSGPDGRVEAGRGANVLGSPLASLTWLVEKLARSAQRLAPGDIVLTGTMTPPVALTAGARWQATYRLGARALGALRLDVV